MTYEPDPVDQIARALSQLRGGRRPWPHGPHGMHGGHHGGPPGGRHGGEGGGEHRWGGPARMRVMEELARSESALSVSEIAELIGVDQPRASRLVQQGIELGVLVRETDPADARRSLIRLTDGGREIIERFRGARRASVAGALADFSDAERIELARLLAKFAASWRI